MRYKEFACPDEDSTRYTVTNGITCLGVWGLTPLTRYSLIPHQRFAQGEGRKSSIGRMMRNRFFPVATKTD